MFESRSRKSLGEQIGKVVGTRNVADINGAILCAFANIMKTDIDMLAVSMVGGVISK